MMRWRAIRSIVRWITLNRLTTKTYPATLMPKYQCCYVYYYFPEQHECFPSIVSMPQIMSMIPITQAIIAGQMSIIIPTTIAIIPITILFASIDI